MPVSRTESAKPTVSIILPTYNRARFLPEAIASIRSQTFSDWELIVVDDGSTDGTRELVEDLARGLVQPIRYICQENRGPGAARNSGVQLASGRYLAFLDSDDAWLAHHLKDCVDELEANPDVDWVFTASRGENREDGSVSWENSFHEQGGLVSFLRVNTERRGRLRVLNDTKLLEVLLREPVHAGFQLSVIRATVFSHVTIPDRRIGEDQLFVVLSVSKGFRLAYLDDVHVMYRVHADNASLCTPKPLSERLALMWEFSRGFEELRERLTLSRSQRRALDVRLAALYFWTMGYPLALEGRFDEAFDLFRRAIRLNPWNITFHKTYAITGLKSIVAHWRARAAGTEATLARRGTRP